MIDCGFLLRDHLGRLMAVKMTRLSGPLKAFAAETLSYREALSWLKTNGYQRVVVESDSLLMVSTITKVVPYNVGFLLYKQVQIV